MAHVGTPSSIGHRYRHDMGQLHLGQPPAMEIPNKMVAAIALPDLLFISGARLIGQPGTTCRLSAVYNIFAFAAMIPLIFIIPHDQLHASWKWG